MGQLGDSQVARRFGVPNAVRLFIVATSAVVLVASCSSGGGGADEEDVGASGTPTSETEAAPAPTDADATTATTVSPTTTAPGPEQQYDSVEDEIAARYEAYWDSRFAANSPPNPDDAALREYATGAQLDHVVQETQANLEAGVEFRHPDAPVGFRQVRVVSVDGDTAVVQECVVNDGLVVRRDTGEVVDDAVATYNVRGDMRRVDGEWRLAAANQVQRWEGVAGCALAD